MVWKTYEPSGRTSFRWTAAGTYSSDGDHESTELLLLDEHTAALDPGTAEKVLNLTKRIVEEHQLTCLMITHNMQSAIDLGNRILMMDSGNIVLDIGEEEKKNMTVDALLEKFKTGAGKALDNDRILLSE